jgi:hypothetical protein
VISGLVNASEDDARNKVRRQEATARRPPNHRNEYDDMLDDNNTTGTLPKSYLVGSTMEKTIQ